MTSSLISLEKGDGIVTPATSDSATETLQDVHPEYCVRSVLSLIGGFLCLFVIFGLVSSYSIFQTHYESDLLSQYTPSQISWIGSTSVFVIFATSIISGRWFDRSGLRGPLLLGSLGAVVSIMLLSISTQFWS